MRATKDIPCTDTEYEALTSLDGSKYVDILDDIISTRLESTKQHITNALIWKDVAANAFVCKIFTNLDSNARIYFDTKTKAIHFAKKYTAAINVLSK